MSHSGQNEPCNCAPGEVEKSIFQQQTRKLLNMAADWFNSGRFDAAEICTIAAKRLLAVSGSDEMLLKKRYFTLRSGIAQAKGQHKAALRHANQAYRLSCRIYTGFHYKLGVDECNLGECLAIVGRTKEGVKLLQRGLERIRAYDFGSNQGKLEWQRSIIEKVSLMISAFSSS